MIEKYRFGSIVINEKEYNYDIEVYQDGTVLNWQREESHLFQLKDLQRALEQKPNLIIFGTGAYGIARISSEAQKRLRELGIGFVIDRTGKAVKVFNTIKEKKAIGLFHVTC